MYRASRHTRGKVGIFQPPTAEKLNGRNRTRPRRTRTWLSSVSVCLRLVMSVVRRCNRELYWRRNKKTIFAPIPANPS